MRSRRIDRLARRLDQRQERSTQVEQLVESGLLDPTWIGRQLGVTCPDPTTAAEALLDADETAGPVSPHPLVELGWARPGHPWLAEQTTSVLWWLRSRNRREGLVPHPLIDVAAIVAEHPDAARHPGGPVGHWLSTASPEDAVPTPPKYPPVTLADVTAAANRALSEHLTLVDLRTGEPATPAPSTPAVAQTEDGGPVVSVVLILRDDAQRLHEVVRRLGEQTCTSWELLAVDAGSTDDTGAILSGLAHFDLRVVPIALEPGAEPDAATARNVALERARGRYVAFLDGHRPWRPEHLATATAYLDTTDTTVPVVVASPGRGPRGDRASLLAGGPIDPATVVARREAVAGVGGFYLSLGDDAGDDLVLRLVGERRLVRLDYDALAGGARSRSVASRHRPLLLDRYLVDWSSAPALPGHGTSVVVAVRDEAQHSVRWLEKLVAAGADAAPAVELVLVGGGVSRTHHVLAATLASLSDRVRVAIGAVDPGPATAFNLGLVQAGGEHVVLVRADAEADLDRLAELVSDEAAISQPLVIGPDGIVASAGSVFVPGSRRPQPLLEGLPARDARDRPPVALAAPLGPVVALRRADALSLRGFDASYADGLPEVELGLRAGATGIPTRLVPTVLVECPPHRAANPRRLAATATRLETDGVAPPVVDPSPWAVLGFEVVGLRTEPLDGPTGPVLVPRAAVRPAPPTAVRVAEAPPRLRWTIDTAVPAGPGGESWGDLHFARSLADALERNGQHVAVDRREARGRTSRDLDDVVLTLRGLDPVPFRPGPVNLLWVISHPDDVDRTELSGYDAAYAASTTWAAETSERWGSPISPLLQCTDAQLFHPGLASADDDDGSGPVLFVGNSRGVFRRSLRAAVAAGVPVEVHGKGWREYLGRGAVASTGIDNADLGRAYADASVVLNDHWDDMRRDGFLSNRLFDAGACGARILTDEVAGVVELFGPLVRTFSTDQEVAEILADPAAAFGSREERLKRAAVIVAEHSFDRRAATLIEDAARLVRARV